MLEKPQRAGGCGRSLPAISEKCPNREFWWQNKGKPTQFAACATWLFTRRAAVVAIALPRPFSENSATASLTDRLLDSVVISPISCSNVPSSIPSDSVRNDSEALASVPVSQTPIERFEEYLVARGLRKTDQRRFLVEQVFSRHEHFDADQLIDQLPRRGDANYVSRPTVYRTLKEFVDAGLLRRFELNGRSVYEHDYGYPEHDHLYCVKCNRLIEFQSEEIAKLRDEIGRTHRFRVRSHRLIIQGVCQDCSSRQSQRRRQDRV